MGCPGCGVVAAGHGRRLRRLHDIPAFGSPVELVWRARRYRCSETACGIEGFTEDAELAVAAREADHPGGVVGDQLHPT
ncbi:MAG: transposase family protein [Nocardioidaceae bacterium]